MMMRSIAGCWFLVACSGEVTTSTDEWTVMGGTAAPLGKWPDVAAVMFNGAQGCTGTLVAPNVVLTAGHCNDSTLKSVLIGTNSLAYPERGELRSVKYRFEYPNSQSSYDLTALVLATPSTKEPRAIATGWARFDIANGGQVALVGYGAVDQWANEFLDELQEATSTITDADCTRSSGCFTSARPAGELGAGGMGIDTCPGDSGGPLYLMTSYGTYLAGVTSRSYDDSETPCRDGGIYVRPDKLVDWIETKTGARIRRGPEPQALPILAVRDTLGETAIVSNDPKTDAHTFTIKTPPKFGTAKVMPNGKVRVCGTPGRLGDDSLVVTVADTANAKRAIDLEIPIEFRNGAAATEACNLDQPDPEPEQPGQPEQPGEGEGESTGSGGGCATTRDGSWAIALAGVALLRRRRRR